MVGTLNDIPLMHEWFQGRIYHREASMEQPTAEVSKGFVVGVLSTACKFG